MFAFENLPDEYRKIGQQWAKSKAEYEFLDEERKTVLARCASQHEGSEATRDRLGRLEETYYQHLKAMKNAREEYLGYETYLHAMDMRFDWYRSQNANNRAEMKFI